MNQNDVVELYTSLLEGIGLLAKVDGDGDVVFKYPDLGTMFFSVDERDPEYLMLVFPNFADEKALNISRDQLLVTLNSVNSKCKGVKLFAREDKDDGAFNVTATIEAFIAPSNTLPDRTLLEAVIKRNMSAMRASVQTLIKEAQKLNEQTM